MTLPQRKDNMWEVFNPQAPSKLPSNESRSLSKPGSSQRSEPRSGRYSAQVPAKLPPIIANRSLPQIQADTDAILAGVRDAPAVQMQARMRELQVNLFDIKASFQRRLQRIAQEIPGHLKRELKISELKTTDQTKEVEGRLLAQQDALLLLKDSFKVNLEDLNSRVTDQSAQSEETQARLTAIQRNVARVQKLVLSLQNAGPRVESQTGGSGASGGANIALQTDLALLRDALEDMRRQHKTTQGEMNSRLRQIREQVAISSGQMAKKIDDERGANSQAHRFLQQQNEKRDLILVEQLRGEMELMKQQLGSMEHGNDERRRLQEKEMHSLHEWVEMKMKTMTNDITQEEREKMVREKNIIDQFRDGFQAMNEMVKDNKEEGVFQMSKTEIILRDELTQLGEEQIAMRKAVGMRLEAVETTANELRTALQEQQIVVAKQNQSLNENLEREVTRFEKMVGALESRANELDTELHGKIAGVEESLTNWRKVFEAKIDSRLQELQRAIKQTIGYVGKVAEDSKQRDALLSEEYKTFHKTTETALGDMRGKIEVDDSAVEERLSKMAAQMFEKVNEEVANKEKLWDGISATLNEKTKEEVKEGVEKSQERIMKYIEKMKEELREEAKQRDLMIEGGSQAFTLGVEKRLKKLVESSQQQQKKLQKDVMKRVGQVHTILESEAKLRESQINQSKSDITALMQQENEELWRGLQEGDTTLKEEFQKTLDVMKEDVLEHMTKIEKEAREGRSVLAEKKQVEKSFKEKDEKWEEQLRAENKEMVGKFGELVKMHDVQRRVVDDTMDKHVQAMKALAKAMVVEERADREAKNEQIMEVLNGRIDKNDLAHKNAIDARAEEVRSEIKLLQDDMGLNISNIEKKVREGSHEMRQKAEEMQKRVEEIVEGVREQVDQNTIRGVLGEVIERVAIEDDIVGIQRENVKEIGLAEERIQERVEAVRELLQNDLDHAMKEVKGGGEGDQEGGLKAKMRKVKQEVKDIANEVDQKLNTLDFKLVELEQKIEKVQGESGTDDALQNLREKELKPLKAKVDSLEEEVKGLKKQEE